MRIRNMALAVLVIVLTSFVVGCSSNFVTRPETTKSTASPPGIANKPTNGLVQSNNEASVEIDVELSRTENTSLVFTVVMNTHSVDLDKYSLDELATLWDDEGNEYRPTSWNAPLGGHHRSGTMVFPLPDSVAQGKAKYIKMVIRDVAGIEERVLRWEW